LRLQVLENRALPASRRALEVSQTGYASGRTDLTALLVAWRGVVDTEEQIVMTRGTLDHALADLDAAVGEHVAPTPLRESWLAGGESAGASPSNEAGHGN